jgi:hypothetical protein
LLESLLLADCAAGLSIPLLLLLLVLVLPSLLLARSAPLSLLQPKSLQDKMLVLEQPTLLSLLLLLLPLSSASVTLTAALLSVAASSPQQLYCPCIASAAACCRLYCCSSISQRERSHTPLRSIKRQRSGTSTHSSCFNMPGAAAEHAAGELMQLLLSALLPVG